MSAARGLVPALSVTLIVSWGSLYYAFAVLVRPIQTELGWAPAQAVGAYSLALLVTGLVAYPVGKLIDRHGGRALMTIGSCLAAVLLLSLSQIDSLWSFYAIWFGLGVAMALTLYDPAFAVIVAAFPHGFRKRIGILTLTGGLASTVFWPLTHALVEQLGWRAATAALGALHLALCAPLHWLTVPTRATTHHPPLPGSEVPAPIAPGVRVLLRRPAFWLVGLCFMAFGIVTAALAVHVLPLLESRGLSAAAAVALAALIGPMQVSSRFLEVLSGSRLPALALGAVTVALIPLALTTLLLATPTAVLLYLFVLLYGAGLGLTTIMRATTPAELFGRGRYASVSGALSGPAIMARALGPIAATAVLTTFGGYDGVLVFLLATALAGALAYAGAVHLHRQRR
jgi:MFS family permease